MCSTLLNKQNIFESKTLYNKVILGREKLAKWKEVKCLGTELFQIGNGEEINLRTEKRRQSIGCKFEHGGS